MVAATIISAEGDLFPVDGSRVASSELLSELLRLEGEDPVLVPLPSRLLGRALAFLRVSSRSACSSLPRVSTAMELSGMIFP